VNTGITYVVGRLRAWLGILGLVLIDSLSKTLRERISG
jgi:hypothetical protein